MDSAALTTYLAAEWAEAIADLGIDVARVVATVEEVYAADTTLDAAYAEALGDYYLLRRAVRITASDFNVSPEDGGSYALSQRHAQYKALLAEAAANVEWIVGDGGGLVTVTSAWGMDAVEASDG